MAVSPGSALSLNQISLRRRWGVLRSDSLMVTFYGTTRVEVESTSDFNPAKIKPGPIMLFPSDSIARKRRKLVQQIRRGSLTAEQAFRQALAFDPFDSLAMTTVGLSCEARGDHEEARRYFW